LFGGLYERTTCIVSLADEFNCNGTYIQLNLHSPSSSLGMSTICGYSRYLGL
jgi:hypothetical protein